MTKGKKRTRGCLYDDLFSVDTAREAITKTYGAIRQYGVRNYGKHLKKRDVERLADLTERGGYALKLMFVLAMLAHDAALREQVEDTADPESLEKAKGFYRVLALAVRSVYVSPFTERSVRRIILGAIRFCFVAWECFDAAGMTHLCDWYSARPE